MGYELATSIHFRYDFTCKRPVTEEIERVAHCGFENLDFNFLDMCINKKSDFLKPNYEKWLEECAKVAKDNKAKFVQAHAPCESVYDKSDYNLLLNLCKKAIKGCAILGIPWMVFHPITDCISRFGINEDNHKFNLKFFRELLPYAKEYNVGMAIEEIVPFYEYSRPENIVDDLIRLIDELDTPYVGACWDCGHANLLAVIEGAEHLANQSEQIIKIGDRLKCTHIHDNNAGRFAEKGLRNNFGDKNWEKSVMFDEHIQPYAGTIDWDDVIRGLDKINYSHYFTYEAHHAANTLPEEIVNDALIHLRKIGETILSKSTLK